MKREGKPCTALNESVPSGAARTPCGTCTPGRRGPRRVQIGGTGRVEQRGGWDCRPRSGAGRARACCLSRVLHTVLRGAPGGGCCLPTWPIFPCYARGSSSCAATRTLVPRDAPPRPSVAPLPLPPSSLSPFPARPPHLGHWRPRGAPPQPVTTAQSHPTAQRHPTAAHCPSAHSCTPFVPRPSPNTCPTLPVGRPCELTSTGGQPVPRVHLASTPSCTRPSTRSSMGRSRMRATPSSTNLCIKGGGRGREGGREQGEPAGRGSGQGRRVRQGAVVRLQVLGRRLGGGGAEARSSV